MTSPLLALRARFDPTVLAWPGVVRRTMMGYPGYSVHGRLFAFFGTDEVILKCPDDRRSALLALPGAYAWAPPGSGMTRFGQWLALPATENSDDALCDALELAYRHVSTLEDIPRRAGMPKALD